MVKLSSLPFVVSLLLIRCRTSDQARSVEPKHPCSLPTTVRHCFLRPSKGQTLVALSKKNTIACFFLPLFFCPLFLSKAIKNAAKEPQMYLGLREPLFL